LTTLQPVETNAKSIKTQNTRDTGVVVLQSVAGDLFIEL
jgi:hypothetical protein